MRGKKAFWIGWISLMCIFLYCVRKGSLHLLWIDLKGGFRYTPERIRRIIVTVFLCLTAAALCGLMLKKGSLKLSWDIRIRKRQIEFNTEKLPYMRLGLLIGISSFMLLVPMFVRDLFVCRGGSQLEYSLIAHAFGRIDDKTYTNSKEALLYNYGLGHRAFEVDFSITADEKLVCLHDWRHGAAIQGRDGEEQALTRTEFESIPLYEKYTPISVEEVLLFMAEHEDVWIITDSKETAENLVMLEFGYIVDMARYLGVEQVLNRISVQIYNPEMYEVICGIYKFPSFIFTLYQYWDGDTKSFPDICRFCAYNDIDIITMWHYLATPKVMEIAKQYGLRIYVHTVNDMETVKGLMDIGVTGFYTDYLIPAILEKGD